ELAGTESTFDPVDAPVRPGHPVEAEFPARMRLCTPAQGQRMRRGLDAFPVHARPFRLARRLGAAFAELGRLSHLTLAADADPGDVAVGFAAKGAVHDRLVAAAVHRIASGDDAGVVLLAAG